MIDINSIINNSANIQKRLESRGYQLDIEAINKLYLERKSLINSKENYASQKNKLNSDFKNLTSDIERSDLKSESQRLEKIVLSNKIELDAKEKELNKILLDIPNIPDDNTPIGLDENSNKLIKQWGDVTKNNIEHSKLLSKLGLLDFDSASKMTKSRFVVMKGAIAKLHRALISYMLDTHTCKNNYIEFNVPYIVNNDALIGTGQLPKFEEDLFKISNSNLYLIPTAEVPLTNLYRNKILLDNELPICVVAHTPCFRSEAGSYGQDTKGIIRMHQFEKVELVQIVKPEDAEKSLESITRDAETILENLEIPYQRILLSSGDLGFASSITYDLEAWLPSQKKYREISSCSCFTDFQSRRLNIKYRDPNTKKKNYLYTLNGSGLAIGRTLAAIIENNINDNEILIPEVLHEYTDFKTIKL